MSPWEFFGKAGVAGEYAVEVKELASRLSERWNDENIAQLLDSLPGLTIEQNHPATEGHPATGEEETKASQKGKSTVPSV